MQEATAASFTQEKYFDKESFVFFNNESLKPSVPIDIVKAAPHLAKQMMPGEQKTVEQRLVHQIVPLSEICFTNLSTTAKAEETYNF